LASPFSRLPKAVDVEISGKEDWDKGDPAAPVGKVKPISSFYRKGEKR